LLKTWKTQAIIDDLTDQGHRNTARDS